MPAFTVDPASIVLSCRLAAGERTGTNSASRAPKHAICCQLLPPDMSSPRARRRCHRVEDDDRRSQPAHVLAPGHRHRGLAPPRPPSCGAPHTTVQAATHDLPSTRADLRRRTSTNRHPGGTAGHHLTSPVSRDRLFKDLFDLERSLCHPSMTSSGAAMRGDHRASELASWQQPATSGRA